MDMGGNRKKKHIVGGATSNVAYTPGANLQMARSGFQQNQGIVGTNAMQRGFFQGQQDVAPNFSAVQTNQMQAGQAPGQAQSVGNTLFQNTMGNVRPANAPAGLGFGRSNALGVVRQHTISGNEGLDSGMTYTPTAAPPPPPPTPVAPPQQTTGTSGTGTLIPGANPNDGTPLGTVLGNILTDAQGRWTPPAGIKIGDPVPGREGVTYAGTAYLTNGQYAPIIKYTKTGISQIDPTWQTWMQSAAVFHQPGGPATPPAPTSTAPKPTAPAPVAPAPAPTPVVQPPAPIPTNQSIRQKYAGNWSVGTMIRAADGTTYKVLGGTMQNGVYKPIVAKPGGGTMIHPAWQGSW